MTSTKQDSCLNARHKQIAQSKILPSHKTQQPTTISRVPQGIASIVGETIKSNVEQLRMKDMNDTTTVRVKKELMKMDS